MKIISETVPWSPKRAHSIREICENLGVSKGVVVKEIRRGKLRAKRVGRRLVILDCDFCEYLDQASA